MNTQQEWINARTRLNRLLIEKQDAQLNGYDLSGILRSIDKEKSTVSALRGRMIREQNPIRGRVYAAG